MRIRVIAVKFQKQPICGYASKLDLKLSQDVGLEKPGDSVV